AVSPTAWAAAWSPSTSTGDVQPSASSQRAGGWLGRRGSTAVDTPNRSTPSGSPPLSTQSWMTRTSAWPWGPPGARDPPMAGRRVVGPAGVDGGRHPEQVDPVRQPAAVDPVLDDRHLGLAVGAPVGQEHHDGGPAGGGQGQRPAVEAGAAERRHRPPDRRVV